MRSSTLSAVAWAALAAQSIPAQAASTFFSDLHPCPAACDGKPDSWAVYSSVSRLDTCPGPMLADFNVFNLIDDDGAVVRIRACNAGSDTKVNALIANDKTNTHNIGGPDGKDVVNGTEPQPHHTLKSTSKRASLDTAGSCASSSKSKVSFELATSGDHSSLDAKPVLGAVEKYLADSANCDEVILFGYGSGIAVGIHSGKSIDNKAIPSIVEALEGQLDSLGQSTVLQLCSKDRTVDNIFGIAIDMTGDLASVQKSIRSWSNATCIDTSSKSSHSLDLEILEVPLPGAVANVTKTVVKASEKLQARADCRTITVVSGDGCGSLASKCGISAQDFTTFNPSSTLCSTLAVGQSVCCSAGTLPDKRPKPNADGTCATYTVQNNDYCALIAASYGLTATDLETFNDKVTWGWFGCQKLLVGQKICLSTGSPPLPAPVANAVCGPTVPGTVQPPQGKNITDLNPCPLNTCCNIWGQCGITPDYCTDEKGPKGNPGTAPDNKNGCISNCGTAITNNADPPSRYLAVGYYEAFNWERNCLNMRISTAGDLAYTHMHWAFATINPDFSIGIDDPGNQWEDFKKITPRKILSFGGWGYSTSPATYDMLRQAVSPANRDVFIANIIKFVADNGLDGVDFDWEYPGAPDIPGIPAGPASDGPNYLAFLQALRPKLNSLKTISICAPASFWYLKAFPIADMANQLDYIVYLTYDLHGQWDYGSPWAQDGCMEGNCLRSHVNLTETGYALAMITKAGVKANKITVGISSYGRSFGMADPSCTGPLCRFDGTVSNGAGAGSTAEPGRCTNTAGYISNAELNEKLILGESAHTWYDKDSDSNLMVYDGNNWVAYMDKDTRQSRTDYYQSLNFAGTIDWAVDLLTFTADDGQPGGDEGEDGAEGTPTICDGTYNTLDDVANDANIPSVCVNYYTIQVLKKMYEQAMVDYQTILKDDYSDKFNTYSHAVADHVDESMRDFIFQNGNKYFTCEVGELSVCCDNCNTYPGSCPYCFKGTCTQTCTDDGAGICVKKRDLLARSPMPEDEFSGASLHPLRSIPNTLRVRTTEPIIKWVRAAEPCPPDYSKHGYGYIPDTGITDSSVWWTLVQTDNFYADLLDNTGVPKEKTKIAQTSTRVENCTPGHGTPKPDDTDSCGYLGYDYNIPVPDHYTASDVANPQDIVAQAQSASGGLGQAIQDALDTIDALSYGCADEDLVDAIGLPIFMIQEAVYQMSQVVKVADEITEAQRKALILAFVGAILFLLPVIGEALGSVAELADIAAIVSAIGEIGNVAFDVYSIVDDPKNSLFSIFSLILAPLALLDVAQVAKAANFRRGLSTDDVTKLGPRVGESLGKIEKIKPNVCKL
ncbi:hypothetical protein Trco_004652 [Trichoderma cornu-damae]|uniref:chitinase n=1 Tax=Trichoderma cornu-damae TaxID=654480 RepID=A0A9P8TVQ5_9HYPO|nr:hypothetical protein Trco_004652 [Trichoderma cornu-damae]